MSKMLSPHFSEHECACRDHCGYCDPSPRLLMLAEKVREIFNAPMIVTSVCRCKTHNAKEGGSPTSKHLTGRAMDFYVKGLRENPKAVHDAILKAYDNGHLPELGGLGLYDWGVHIDIAKTADGRLRRWDERKNKR